MNPMKNQFIKTEYAYATALARVEELVDARPGTRHGDEFEDLSLLIHDFEERLFASAKTDPPTAIQLY
jgi:HTH-type transcriptional regulator / antitoxin HigA